LDHHFLHAIHINDWSKFPRPPLEEPEISKPYLMADNVSVLEGYPHLLIKRHPILNTIRNGRFEPLDVAFPDSFWSSYRDT